MSSIHSRDVDGERRQDDARNDFARKRAAHSMFVRIAQLLDHRWINFAASSSCTSKSFTTLPTAPAVLAIKSS